MAVVGSQIDLYFAKLKKKKNFNRFWKTADRFVEWHLKSELVN